mmetsp:Transcript_10287/g.33768  ORF Transcript_10287/g.33768 Transcript_10287/m.33768 type:complete len:232 (+) Transcript_10287:440-1135(+)
MKPSPRSSGAFEAAAAVALYFFRIEPPPAPPPTVTSSPATPSSARLPRRQVFEVLSAAVDGFGGGAAPRSRASSASRPLTLASVVACASVAPKALSLAAIFAYSSRWLCFSAISRRFRSRSVGFLSASDVAAAAGRRARTSLAPDVAITSLAPGVARTSLAPDVFADARTSPPPARGASPEDGRAASAARAEPALAFEGASAGSDMALCRSASRRRRVVGLVARRTARRNR